MTKHTDRDVKNMDFDLIETMLWENGEYFLLKSHLERLRKSAGSFLFPFDKTGINKDLHSEAKGFKKSEKYRTRLVLKRSGRVRLSSEILSPIPELPVKITFSGKHTDKNDLFLYHKTTNRVLYDTELKKYRAKGYFDVVFVNKKKEITEGTITNIVIMQKRRYWTPPVPCGLLEGVYRKFLLGSGEISLREKILHYDDIVRADGVFLINSVRKMIPAVLER